MKVPFSLHKAEHSGAVTAVLLLSDKASDLLALCSHLTASAGAAFPSDAALPPIHAVAGGFLVKLGRPVADIFPGVIRLRSLSANLFVPVDAELSPALLDDEAAGLVRERGLIFLPGGRILAFAPDEFITADKVLTLPRLPERLWNAFPARPARPQRLGEVLLDLEDDTPGLILESGGEGVAEESPRPADSGPIARTVGRAALEAGQGLARLGLWMRWPGLAQLGAALAGGALRSVPRLSESLLGRQEAALRELLRKFRSGNLDEALRHALPLSDWPGRGGQAASDALLPTHGLLYRLADLLGGARGQASMWFGSGDTHAELTREYRKAAEAASARGDYRRAAFIYGRLLHNYRSAAAVLERGGLHHDAAILYLELIKDTLAAARAFEAAGETDRALRLYEQRGDHVLAGDLLRRLGEDEAALRHYVSAADRLAAADNPVAAADLLSIRAQRPDLALGYLARGWVRRPHGSAIPCLLRLTNWYAEQDEQKSLMALVAEAEEFLAPPGHEHAAGQFFNVLAQLADRANLSALRDDLRDRALCGLAGKLRHHAETDVHVGVTVSDLFGQSGVWKAALVSDADFALKMALKKRKQRSEVPQTVKASGQRLRLGSGQVSAVAGARLSGRVFAGFSDGRIVFFDPRSELLVKLGISEEKSPIRALATDERGDQLIARVEKAGECELLAFKITGASYDLTSQRTVSRSGPSWLTPLAKQDGMSIFGIWKYENLDVVGGNNLLSLLTGMLRETEREVRTGLVFWDSTPPADASSATVRYALPLRVCLFVGEAVWCCKTPRRTEDCFLQLGWRPGSTLRGLCSPPPLSWLWREPTALEFTGIDSESDSIHWSELNYSDPDRPVLANGASTRSQSSYRAAALVRPGLIAGVYDRGVDWLRRRGHSLEPSSATLLALGDAVACFPSPPTRELLVVCGEGSLARVPLLS
jgi:tetratricopeptide (TPR) repeat protein